MKSTLGILALALSGCCAYTEVGYIKSPVRTESGDVPIAAVSIQNISYSLFGCIPLCSGTTWKGGPDAPTLADAPKWNATAFEDRCTPEENLLSLKAVLGEIGSNKIINLSEETEEWAYWSCFIIRQKMETTTCTVVR